MHTTASSDKEQAQREADRRVMEAEQTIAEQLRRVQEERENEQEAAQATGSNAKSGEGLLRAELGELKLKALKKRAKEILTSMQNQTIKHQTVQQQACHVECAQGDKAVRRLQ